MLLFRSKFILHIKSSSILNKGVLLSNKKEADWLFLTGSEGDKSAAIFTLIISNIYIYIYIFADEYGHNSSRSGVGLLHQI